MRVKYLGVAVAVSIMLLSGPQNVRAQVRWIEYEPSTGGSVGFRPVRWDSVAAVVASIPIGPGSTSRVMRLYTRTDSGVTFAGTVTHTSPSYNQVLRLVRGDTARWFPALVKEMLSVFDNYDAYVDPRLADNIKEWPEIQDRNGQRHRAFVVNLRPLEGTGGEILFAVRSPHLERLRAHLNASMRP